MSYSNSRAEAGTPDLNDRWNPYLTYVCTMKQIRSWVDRYGTRGFYNGETYRLNYDRICAGRYEVRFEKS